MSVDRTKLREAIEHCRPEGYPPELLPVFEAARLVADENTLVIDWCETHNAEGIENHGGPSDECWRVVWVDGGAEEARGLKGLCRMVERTLLAAEVGSGTQ